ncbi:hypothetical protein ACH347_36975 [Saccharopolyspora sp. 5N102]|uniref:hypothetical protein n=1 Tax=Saccharopolyspora sp. 5N102 TaxID=3375155 RepID=UPI0037AC4773
MNRRLIADAAPGAFTEMADIGDSAMFSSTQGQAEVHFRSGNLLVWLTFSGRDLAAGQPVPISRQQAIETTLRLAREITTKLDTVPG